MSIKRTLRYKADTLYYYKELKEQSNSTPACLIRPERLKYVCQF